ncbi:MAG: glycoside hydrolase family 2 protein [Bacteroidetes bacterium]|nr:glycoside hydrolase family 2 protein [Bacteroidota bacterium]
MTTKNLRNLFLIGFSIFAFLSCGSKQEPLQITLSKDWSFKAVGEQEWSTAEVPGTVHTDLMHLGLIQDPFYRLNEHELQWIDKKDWVYRCIFEVPKKILAQDHIALNFEGLDTYAQVRLNDSLILKSDNMFRHFNVPVKNLLKPQDNTLEILFESPINKGVEKFDALGYSIPMSGNDLAKIGQVEGQKEVSIFTRKAGYHFGWDWGPRLVTSGIWRPVSMEAWSGIKIQDLFVRQNLKEDKAELTAEIEVLALETNQNASAQVEIFVDGEVLETKPIALHSGVNHLKVPFVIDNPELWWPNGLGDQRLYDVGVRISQGQNTDKTSQQVGLRTLELIREPDNFGTSFYFKVNGVPVFMKGTNYIPQDPFLTRPTSEHYKFLLESARDAHMNMIRVWGGGVYESDEFYALCDQYGLLVWQDFMFACAVYPGEPEFLDNIKQEAIDNVKRLRNHTSIALWCGNNESLSAWENWGWKEQVAKEQSQVIADSIWGSYDTLFHQLLPEVVAQYDGDRNYWSSSPSADMGVKEQYDSGDLHYWWVWWGKKAFEEYNTAIPRFMSEYGFQSFPEYNSVLKYTTAEDHDIYSEVMTSHQRSSIGNETIEEYMLRDYNKPKDFASYLYVSQLLQAKGIKIAIEAHRRHRDQCMGTLYWQLNDCWPVASWSGIDYYGKWKALHYTVKEAFKPYLLSQEIQENQMSFFVISDELDDASGQLLIELFDFEGKVLRQWNESILVQGNQTNPVFKIPMNALSQAGPINQLVITAEFHSENEALLAENKIYLVPPKDLNLPDPGISWSVSDFADHYAVTIKAARLAKNVFVSSTLPGNFSENYFDLLPGEEKTITISKVSSTALKNHDLETFKTFDQSLKIQTLKDSY